MGFLCDGEAESGGRAVSPMTRGHAPPPTPGKARSGDWCLYWCVRCGGVWNRICADEMSGKEGLRSWCVCGMVGGGGMGNERPCTFVLVRLEPKYPVRSTQLLT